VGRRRVKPPPVPDGVAAAYRDGMTWLWRLQRPGDGGRAVGVLTLSAGADDALAELESWLEPQMAEGGELAFLAGWAQKMAGAVARIAAVLHLAAQSGRDGVPDVVVPRRTLDLAVQLGRDYLLPHAKAAFQVMGADPRVAKAAAVLKSLPGLAKEVSVTSVTSVTCHQGVSRRDINRKHHRLFKKVEELDPVLDLLVRHGWLRPTGEGRPGRGGAPSPLFLIHPAALASRPGPLVTGDTGDTAMVEEVL
jgi:hypothetical protein